MRKTYVFYIFIILSSIFFSSKPIFGITDHHKISWVDSRHLHNELDLRMGNLQMEVSPGVWKIYKQVELQGIDLNVFPSEYEVKVHKVKSGYLFNIPGTGLVFSLDTNYQQFKRIDKTFFRGFNFHSFSFVRNDTLYSIGGEGFWNTNSTLIYFDKKHQEWEKVNLKNKGPISLEWNFGGYSQINDTFYALSGFEEFKENDFNSKLLYSLNLSSQTWSELGYINTKHFTNQITKAKTWLGDFLLYVDGDIPKVYILDPIQNRILLYEGNNNQLKLGSNEIIRDKDQLFIYRKENQGVIVDSISIKELFKDSKVIGKLYLKRVEVPWHLISSVIFLLTILVSVLFYLRMKKFEKKYLWFEKSERMENLPEHLMQVLKHFQLNGKDVLLSTNQMNDLLGIKSNSFETTRQQRSRDLKAINDYFNIHYGVSEAIIRKNSEKDKRQTFYSIDDKAFRILSKLNLEK